MKNMKKLFAMALAVMMVLTLATTAFAADITITGGAAGSEYAAYKLLNATDGGDDKLAYTLNSTYTSILETVTGKEIEAEIVAYIAGLDTDGIRTFADAVYAKIVEANISADYTADDNEFEGVAQGYYLIAETKVGNTADTFSLVMLDTAGASNIEVSTKENSPTVEKKVEEKNDTTGATSWGDSADYDVGDDINFEITGSVSNKYADYESYYYSFRDTMSDGLTYNKDAKVYVVNGETETEVTDKFVITTLANGFTATSNLKEVFGVTINDTTKIVVKYTATLNDKAVMGTAGNINKVVLEYENNPYHEADGDNNPHTPNKPDEPDKPGTTPEDTNVVFTYEVVVNKVDKDGNALAGAGFTLYKQIPDGEDEGTDPDWVAVGEQITDVTTFEFKRLDEGKYKLVETTVPAGYNKAADVEFEIVSTLEGEALTGLTVTPAEGFEVTLSAGQIATSVKNLAGTELPTTGGVGTTLFYLFGGVMVAAAAVLLVTKKRMAA